MIDLERAAEWMSGMTPVRVEPGLCVQARSPKASCRACAEVCPVQAVSLNRGVKLAESCTACGLCAAACPTGAIRMEAPSEVGLLAAGRKVQGSPLVLVCERQLPHLPEGARPQAVTVPCTGAVTAELLAGMVAAGHRQVLLWRPTACGACPNGQASAALVERALAALAQIYPGSVSAGDSLTTPGLEHGERSVAVEQAVLADDRRAFLGSLFTGGGQVLGQLLGGWFGKPAAPKPSLPDPTEVPHRRQILSRALAAVPPAEGGALPGAALAVGAGCTLCVVCSRLCPAGALKLHQDGESATLTWKASMCTGCGLCRDVCPMKAMGSAGTMTFGQLLAEEPETLAHGKPFSTRNDQLR